MKIFLQFIIFKITFRQAIHVVPYKTSMKVKNKNLSLCGYCTANKYFYCAYETAAEAARRINKNLENKFCIGKRSLELDASNISVWK